MITIGIAMAALFLTGVFIIGLINIFALLIG